MLSPYSGKLKPESLEKIWSNAERGMSCMHSGHVKARDSQSAMQSEWKQLQRKGVGEFFGWVMSKKYTMAEKKRGSRFFWVGEENNYPLVDG